MPEFSIMKYVMIAEVRPVIFFGSYSHDEIKGLGTPTSAGFIVMKDGKLCCFGESTTLKLKPAPEDEQIINRYFKEI